MRSDDDKVRLDPGRQLDDLTHRLAGSQVDPHSHSAETLHQSCLLVDVEAKVTDELFGALGGGLRMEHADEVQLAPGHTQRQPCGLVERGPVGIGEIKAADHRETGDRARRCFAFVSWLALSTGIEVVATHPRCWDRGQQIEQAEHLERLIDEKRRAREHRGLDRLTRAVRSSQSFLRVVADRGDNIGSTTARLLQLLDAAGAAELEEAIREVLQGHVIHVGAARQIVDRRRAGPDLPPPVSIPVTRGEHAELVVTPHALSTYDALAKGNA